MVSESDLIFTGTVLSQESFWNEGRTRIYTRSEVEIASVFKGFPEAATVSIYTVGGFVGDIFQFQTHSVEVGEGQSGYFFITEGEIDNSLAYQPRWFVENSQSYDPFIYFLQEKYLPEAFDRLIINETRFPKYSMEESARVKSLLSNGSDTCDIQPVLFNSPKTIEFTFDNVQYTDSFQYVEFDIMAQVNTAGLKFGRCNLFVDYSPEFGSNVVSNQFAIISKSTIIASSAYSLGAQDITAQSLGIQANSNPGQSSNFYTFSLNPEALVHVRMAVQDFSQLGSISFDDIDLSGQVFYWCDGEYKLFDQVISDDIVTAVESPPGQEIGITYTFENQSVIPNIRYKVDIFATATSETSFANGIFYIDYNELGFGSNIVSSENFNFERGPVIQETNTYSVSVLDSDPNTIEISIGAINLSGFGIVSTTPVKIGTLNFTNILDCNQPKGLNFNSSLTETVGFHDHYTGLIPIPLEFYDPISADDFQGGSICGCSQPVINSFSPSTIIAGSGDILTITGENFGIYNASSSRVRFRNGDEGGIGASGNDNNWAPASFLDFVQDGITKWTDTEIQVRVPSATGGNSIKDPACSGRFEVRNACGLEDESDDNLIIPYAVFNVRQAGRAFRLVASADDSNGGICFTLDSSLPPYVRSAFSFALSRWCSELDPSPAFFLNDEIIDIPSSNAGDDINIVILEPVVSDNPNAAAALLTGERITSCEEGEEEFFYLTDFDIVVDPSFITTNPSDGQINEMRNRLTHELGHALMLNHSRKFSSLLPIMYFDTPSSGISIQEEDEAGALQAVLVSQELLSGTDCAIPLSHSIECSQNCPGTNSTLDEDANRLFFVYPNPSNGRFKLLFLDGYPTIEGTLSVYDQLGHKVVEYKDFFIHEDKYIDLDLPVGLYNITFYDGRRTYLSKIKIF